MQSIFRNLLIRLTASIERTLRWLLQTLSSLLQTLSQLLGLNASGYYLEEQNPQSIESSSASESVQPSLSASSRRRAGKEVDSFRKMAQQIQQER